ncbi:MAG: MFS transporter [Gemmatimonadota bacterium]
MTGVVIAAYFAGFLAGSFIVPLFVTRVGHIRVFAALASAASVAALVYSVAVHPVSWVFMRLLTGASFAGLYVVAESWINSRATNATRGRLMAIYMVVLMGGMGLGQMLLNAAEPTGFELFVLSSVLISLAVVPVSLVRTPVPEFEFERPTGLRGLTLRSPLGVLTGFLTGASNAAVAGMGAVYASQVGFSTLEITVFIAAALAGGIAFQWPLGYLSDVVPRRRVIFGATIAASTVALVAANVSPSSGAMAGFAFLYGGMAFPMYSLAISHINDTTPDDSFVGSAAAFVFISGIGAVAGPLVVSGAFEVLGLEGYWWSLGLFYLPVALLALYRIIGTPRVRRSRRHATVPYRVSPVMGNIIGEQGPED